MEHAKPKPHHLYTDFADQMPLKRDSKLAHAETYGLALALSIAIWGFV